MKFDPITRIFINFDAEDGLQSDEFNPGAYFKSPTTGEMFFGGVNGFNSFFPEKIRHHKDKPPIVINKFLLFNEPEKIDPENKDSLLKKAIHETKSITLSYSQNIFSFEFAALHYASPGKNKYKYKLEGYNKDWIETDAKNRRATYTNLPDGDYIFKVKGSNKDGVWNEEGTSIGVNILPPWWKTWWFYSILVIMTITFSFLFWSLLSQRQKVINERFMAHIDKMASLGTLVAGIAHEINNPSSFTHTSAYNLEKDIEKLKTFLIELAGDDVDKEILNAFDEKFSVLFNHLASIKEGTSRISKTVSDLRTFSRMEKEEMKPVKLLEGLQITLNLVKTQYKEKVDFVTNFQADPEVEGITVELNQVFMNIMMNACQSILEKQKRTCEEIMGTLTIQTMEEKEHAVIRFQDTGAGMSKEVKKKMFDPFFTTRPLGEGTGLGLSISFGIIKKHRGLIEVTSEEDEGTTVTLYLPLERKNKYKPKGR